MSNLNARVGFRYDTAANWAANNPVLLEGEVGFESDTDRLKIGDGVTAWVGLGYASAAIDGSAIHSGTAGEIAGIAEKVSPSISDRVLLEDSEDAYNKKNSTVGALLGTRVDRAGDTMTGPLILPGDPTTSLEAAPKRYVDEFRTGRGQVASAVLAGVPILDEDHVGKHMAFASISDDTVLDITFTQAVTGGIAVIAAGAASEGGCIAWFRAATSGSGVDIMLDPSGTFISEGSTNMGNNSSSGTDGRWCLSAFEDGGSNRRFQIKNRRGGSRIITVTFLAI